MSQIGNLYLERQEKSEALEYYRQAISLFRLDSRQSNQIDSIYQNLRQHHCRLEALYLKLTFQRDRGWFAELYLRFFNFYRQL